MKLAMMLPAKPDLKWTLARQVGVEYAVTKAASDLSGLPPPWEPRAVSRNRGSASARSREMSST